ncbi:hypothetical protein DFR48_10751 [Ciceribacter lividus]|uniref:Uncharacterized protein n=1 Tax=Ciceribacter lividus TaxID=1197950 RepID=A0A6I7HK41_9HYPH|nr:hypothetical protein [Ciceribacter lividus]RCW23182.1 hypothetical protein DFR48_10751 [Ciceribacter lividus]
MMTTGEEIFWKNAHGVLRDIGMSHLDPAHGAAVDVVRWCLLVRGRPTHHLQTFLEIESPALLAYLERLATSGDAAGWRTLFQRIRHYAELLHETDMQPCARPWLAAIWHCLPELVGIGQTIIDEQTEPESVAAFELAPDVVPAGDDKGGDSDKGSAGKAGSAGTTAKPRPSARLVLPVVSVMLTDAERKMFERKAAESGDKEGPETDPDVTVGTDGPSGMKGGPK